MKQTKTNSRMRKLVFMSFEMKENCPMRYLTLTILIAIIFCYQNASSAPQTVRSVPEAGFNSETGLENLGNGLLDGLLDDLGDQLPPVGEAKRRPVPSQQTLPPTETPPAGKSWLPQTDQLRRQMNQQMGGEDVGQQQPSPLTPIAQRMQSAAQLISVDGNGAEQPAPVQKQVVADLDKLIAQMEKECQGGGECKPKPEKEKQASKRSKPKPGKESKPGKPSSKPSQAAAKDSTTRMGSAPVANANGQSPEDLMKAAWGHLPARLREQMVQSSSDEFLPEYQEELEKYFQRLAEREAAEGSE